MRRPWIECETCRGWPRDGQRAATTLRATGRWRCRRCGGTSVCGEPLRWCRAQRPVSVRQWQEVQEMPRSGCVTRLWYAIIAYHELVTAALQHDRSAGVDHPKMNVERRTDRERRQVAEQGGLTSATGISRD